MDPILFIEIKILRMNKPQVAGMSPQMEELEEGKSYAWCACGVAKAQPWCDGAHKSGDLRPLVFKAEASEKRAMCMCKQTKNPPFCDGSHSKLPADAAVS
jgi:CDGSH-type Zn-finger protein